MLVSYQKLINLPVITESGINLGKVVKVEIDTDNQLIINYFVKSNNLVKGLLEGELIIHRHQVIKITENNIIVEDNCSKIKLKEELVKIKTVKQQPAVNSLKTGN